MENNDHDLDANFTSDVLWTKKYKLWQYAYIEALLMQPDGRCRYERSSDNPSRADTSELLPDSFDPRIDIEAIAMQFDPWRCILRRIVMRGPYMLLFVVKPEGNKHRIIKISNEPGTTDYSFLRSARETLKFMDGINKAWTREELD